MEGFILNVADSRYDHLVDRIQPACFVLDNGVPVFEVWIWNRLIQRWVVMTKAPDQRWTAQGILYFSPGDIEDLKKQMYTLEDLAGICRKRLPQQS